MTVFYNEIEPYAAEWMENLATKGHIAAGRIDRRSIRELAATDCQATQAHFFAGIGGWSYALRLAGWPDEYEVWTGSCPCQPFSVAGRKTGFDDERHLWPEWFQLIRECRPPIIFGEQVASPDGLKWFDSVSVDLERAGYAVGAADLCAASVGAPHIRQRLYFVAIAGGQRWKQVSKVSSRSRERSEEAWMEQLSLHSRDGHVADYDETGCAFERSSRLHDQRQCRNDTFGCSQTGGLANSCSQGRQQERGSAFENEATHGREGRDESQSNSHNLVTGDGKSGSWPFADWLPCRDGKYRPVEPGTFPLAYGISNRVGRLRAYGNAIVPQVAATFINATMEMLYDRRGAL